MKNDIVYFVKDAEKNEELVYSLRSVDKNFPHNKVWFFGGCPNSLKPDVHVPVVQDKGSKYQNVREMIWCAINNPDLSDDFYLFNDDTVEALKRMNKDCLNYELHIPMLINKEKAKRIFNAFDNTVAFRSSYGNYYQTARAIHPDVKIIDDDKTYDPDIHNVFLSSSDYTWNYGLVGDYVRSKFPEPSRFEV